MKINKITLLMAIMIISILAIGAVSAESIDDATISADDSDLSVATVDSEISDVSAVADDAVVDDVVGDDSLGEPKTIDINDDTYSTYFDENGMLDTVSDHDTLVVGTLTEKDLKVNKPVTITGNGEGVINNGTITLTADASGSSIDGLTIVYEGADLSYYHGIIDIMGGAKDITLSNNVINVTATNEGGTAMAIFLSGNIDNDLISNVTISNNEINMDGTARYLYAVDAISNNWASDDTAVSGIDAYKNKINL